MVRMRIVIALFLCVGSLAGCKSATQTPGAPVPGFALRETDAEPADVDPRVAQVEQDARKWFGKSDTPPTKREEAFAEAKANLKDPEGLYLKQAAYLQTAAKVQPEALEQARQIYAMLLKDNPKSKNAMMGLAQVDFKADRLEDLSLIHI